MNYEQGPLLQDCIHVYTVQLFAFNRKSEYMS